MLRQWGRAEIWAKPLLACSLEVNAKLSQLTRNLVKFAGHFPGFMTQCSAMMSIGAPARVRVGGPVWREKSEAEQWGHDTMAKMTKRRRSFSKPPHTDSLCFSHTHKRTLVPQYPVSWPWEHKHHKQEWQSEGEIWIRDKRVQRRERGGSDANCANTAEW